MKKKTSTRFVVLLTDVCLCLYQLEVRRKLHRPAVWAIFQRRERTEQKEHPRQQSSLPPLLHLSIWTRVCWRHHSLLAHFLLFFLFNVHVGPCVRLFVSLRPLDVECMRALHEKVNIIPLLAKADSLTHAELCRKKMKVRESLSVIH